MNYVVEQTADQQHCQGVSCITANPLFGIPAKFIKSSTLLNSLSSLGDSRWRNWNCEKLGGLEVTKWGVVNSGMERRVNLKACSLADVGDQAKPWPEMWSGQSLLSSLFHALFHLLFTQYMLQGTLASITWWIKVKTLAFHTAEFRSLFCYLLAMSSCAIYLSKTCHVRFLWWNQP